MIWVFGKICSILLILAILFSLSACSSVPLSETPDVPADREGPQPGTAYINDCYIEITNCKAQISTASYNTILVVWIDFQNNSSDSKSLFFTAQIKAYQNGKALGGSMSWIPEDHGIIDDSSTSILPGYSISTGVAFPLDDTSSPVTIQICKGSTVISEKIFYIWFK